MSTPRVTTTLLKPAQDPARVLVVGAGLGTGVQALWSLAAQQLPEDTVVVGYDLPGHGASEPHAEPFSMAELADAVVAAVQALQEDGTVPADLPVHFAGVSLNGCVALQLALDHADTVSGVAVICSAAKIGEAGSWRERAELVERAGTPTLVEGSAQRWFADGFIAAHPERTTGLLHTLQEADRHSYARLCEALADFDVPSAEPRGRSEAAPAAPLRLDDFPAPAPLQQHGGLAVTGVREHVQKPSLHRAPRRHGRQVAGQRRESSASSSDSRHVRGSGTRCRSRARRTPGSRSRGRCSSGPSRPSRGPGRRGWSRRRS